MKREEYERYITIHVMMRKRIEEGLCIELKGRIAP
jgi:hypothetical protein